MESSAVVFDSTINEEWFVDTATGECVYPKGFNCQVDYVERLIQRKGLVKQCRSAMLSKYFASITPAPQI